MFIWAYAKVVDATHYLIGKLSNLIWEDQSKTNAAKAKLEENCSLIDINNFLKSLWKRIFYKFSSSLAEQHWSPIDLPISDSKALYATAIKCSKMIRAKDTPEFPKKKIPITQTVVFLPLFFVNDHFRLLLYKEGNKTVRDGQLEFADFVAVDKRQSRLPSPFIQLRNPCA
ncbi:hypothetical protein Tco_0837393 [Tanacetum coccineum]